ncbi:MAG: elongation factor G [Clostridia bacterium]|nr:elongation factor G [Clostridia bacterium]NCC75259.1 elongation factor G [Clostridia bacterium]
MKNYSATNICNVALLGHGGSGKTAFAEAVLYNAKVTDRLGKSADGNTVLDFDPEEIRRKISINTAVATCEWKNVKLNLLDTPGDFDFVGEVMQALRVADSVLVLVSAKDGVSVGTEKAVRQARKKDLPCYFFVSRMDEANADFGKALESLRTSFGNRVVPFAWPIIKDGKMTGVVDVVDQVAYTFDPKTGERIKIDMPDDMQAMIDELQEPLMEAVAESADHLMEKYFAGEKFTEEELYHGLHDAARTGHVYPVYVGSGLMNWGIRSTLDHLIDIIPTAAEADEVKAETSDGQSVVVKPDDKAPLAAFVFKTIADPFVGRISMFRVYSGSFKANATVYNSSKEKDERIGNVFLMVGKKQIPTDVVNAGDIGAVTKLLVTTTNDTLCDKSMILTLPPIKFPVPCLSMAILPKAKGEEDKIVTGLHKLQDEDPVFTVRNDPETHQIVVSGLGEQQIDVLRSKLSSKFHVESSLEEPRVPYRETIRKKVKVQGKHKKQSGGHGQYGDVWIEFEPGPTEALTFEEKIFGGSVPKSFHPAVEKGLQDAISKGVLAGYPVVNLKATLVDGSYHDVDSSEMSFKLAARLAYKSGLPQASPVLLEPISLVKVFIPDDYLGDIMGDMNKRRGRIVSIDPDDGIQVVTAEVPTSEMAKYATDLKSMTSGRGWYSIEFARYEQAPQIVSDKVIADAKKHLEEDED